MDVAGVTTSYGRKDGGKVQFTEAMSQMACLAP